MPLTHFEELEVWQDARKLCKTIKELTDKPPFSTDFKFRDQIRASSGSVMDNIAEGFERGGNKEFIQFLSIAKGSAAEAKSQIYRAFDFMYITEEDFQAQLAHTEQLRIKIGNFMSYLKSSALKGPKYK